MSVGSAKAKIDGLIIRNDCFHTPYSSTNCLKSGNRTYSSCLNTELVWILDNHLTVKVLRPDIQNLEISEYRMF